MAEQESKNILNEILIEHITSYIIPSMDARAGRSENLDIDNIQQRLNSEFREFEAEVRRDIPGIDGKFAHEIADYIYYKHNPNCPQEKKQKIDDWFLILGIPQTAALEFCIIKYQYRLIHGDELDCKQKETEKLDKYINKHYQELKSIWQNSPN